MRKTTGVLLALCALAAAAVRADDPEPPDDVKAELKKLQGTWTVTKIRDGTRETKPLTGLTFTFDGDKLLTTQIGLTKRKTKDKYDLKESFKVKIDAKKKPHTIDLVPDGKGIGMVGIYKIEKGELYIARGLPGPGKAAKAPERPKDFEGEGVLVYVMTRQKDKEKPEE